MPILFDPAKLELDYRVCTKQFSEDWKSLALRSFSGKTFDVLSKPGITYQDTPTLSECSYFQNVLNSFECELESVRLLRLEAGNYLYEHCKQPFRYEDGYWRVHIPVVTNSRVSFRVNGNLVFMKPGECWYVNCNQPHCVANNGNSDRIHLVIDARRNKWTDSLVQQGKRSDALSIHSGAYVDQLQSICS